MVSPIQCQFCATHRIPALRFCYRCFPNVAVNYIIAATNRGDTYRYKCRMCIKEMTTRVTIYQHCLKNHVQKEYVDLRYPCRLEELAIIASGTKIGTTPRSTQGPCHCDRASFCPGSNPRWTLTHHRAWNGTPNTTPVAATPDPPYLCPQDSGARD